MSQSSYLICSTVRSGSTLLGRTLGQLGGCGQPEEYFHRHIIRDQQLNKSSQAFTDYCESIVRTSLETSGVFGMKMHWWQLCDFLAIARHALGRKSTAELSDQAVLDRFFPNLKFIYLRRENVVAQAVSAEIASQTGEWEKKSQVDKEVTSQSHVMAPRAIKFHPWKIYEWETMLKDQNRCWQAFFATTNAGNEEPYSLTYERLVASFPQEISQVLQHIGISPATAVNDLTMPVKRQANAVNARLISGYTTLPTSISALLLRLYRRFKPLTFTALPLGAPRGGAS